MGWFALMGCATAEEPVRLLYIGWDASEQTRLYIADLDGGDARPLDDGAGTVLDYAVSPDGRRVLYGQERADGGADLWLITLSAAPSTAQLILPCPAAHCSAPVWAPDGRRAIYERRATADERSRLFWLNPATGETLPVFSDEALYGSAARFSADGRLLSYTRLEPLGAAGVAVYAFDDGQTVIIPTMLGGPAAWHPAQPSLLVADLQYYGERIAVHILRVADWDQVVDLSAVAAPGPLLVEDGGPAWSPDGRQIAFSRRTAGVSMGAQIWLMTADGREATAQTADAAVNHSRLAWSPDGRHLLYQQYRLDRPDVRPAIALFDIATGEIRVVIAAGSRPAWVAPLTSN